MAKLFPIKQIIVDENLNGDQFSITRVKLIGSTDHVEIPSCVDAQLLQTDRTTADPTFYMTNSNTRFNIDGGSAGDEHVVVARHQGWINADTTS